MTNSQLIANPPLFYPKPVADSSHCSSAITSPSAPVNPKKRTSSDMLGCEFAPMEPEKKRCLQEVVSMYQQLSQMSTDAMAIMAPDTQAIRWSNATFNELIYFAGKGDADQGASLLRAECLQDAPQATPVQHNISVSPTFMINIWSSSKVVQVGGTSMMLWLMSTTLVGQPAQQQPVPAAGGDVRIEPHTIKHADVNDVDLKVLPGGPRGKRQIKSLWHKYGHKTVNSQDRGQTRQVHRLYYKCSMQGCNARLYMDQDANTGQKLRLEAIGTHNHDIHALNI
eukprot:TRINITY_DN34_c0_g1_i1.p2 TRINITY_DN34_c0_g1~~TRINITY_DN34_c0_g1_i1.p2  ORF type:complete len:282 (-),score=85.55 TRINITY_DN34_c0_g1_i1:247-1092(-)